ncbi:hypothetical protein KIPB_005670 [Kipferlia bialata]|uniref:Uncharacterized protein n=1 Tax=Kipferlia bialata TaxID=797122 RepID=A0A9K3CXN0_9EUKA|nr:hypothetical protein KIPB_005670 [Kipferlia bialata]|eukprot:g5670.t1
MGCINPPVLHVLRMLGKSMDKKCVDKNYDPRQEFISTTVYQTLMKVYRIVCLCVVSAAVVGLASYHTNLAQDGYPIVSGIWFFCMTAASMSACHSAMVFESGTDRVKGVLHAVWRPVQLFLQVIQYCFYQLQVCVSCNDGIAALIGLCIMCAITSAVTLAVTSFAYIYLSLDIAGMFLWMGLGIDLKPIVLGPIVASVLFIAMGIESGLFTQDEGMVVTTLVFMAEAVIVFFLAIKDGIQAYLAAKNNRQSNGGAAVSIRLLRGDIRPSASRDENGQRHVEAGFSNVEDNQAAANEVDMCLTDVSILIGEKQKGPYEYWQQADKTKKLYSMAQCALPIPLLGMLSSGLYHMLAHPGLYSKDKRNTGFRFWDAYLARLFLVATFILTRWTGSNFAPLHISACVLCAVYTAHHWATLHTFQQNGVTFGRVTTELALAVEATQVTAKGTMQGGTLTVDASSMEAVTTSMSNTGHPHMLQPTPTLTGCV